MIGTAPATAILGWIIVASLVTFTLTVLDKVRARRNQLRIPERTLLTAGLIGGSPGLVAAMVLARHKTRKASFQFRVAVVIAVQLGVVIAVLAATGNL